MGQRASSGVQPSGLGRSFKNTARLLLAAGVVMLATGFFAETASASSASHRVIEPKLTAHKATFKIPANNPPTVVWELHLWANGNEKRLGTDSGTSGKLVVPVPTIPGCTFQVDVTRSTKFYSGFQRQLQNCGETAPSTTTTTSTLPPTTTTTHKPKTTGGHGGGTTTTTSGPGTGPGGGSSPPGSSTAPGGQLAFTGAGPGMWFMAALGALFIVAGSLLLLYARRYPKTVMQA